MACKLFDDHPELKDDLLPKDVVGTALKMGCPIAWILDFGRRKYDQYMGTSARAEAPDCKQYEKRAAREEGGKPQLYRVRWREGPKRFHDWSGHVHRFPDVLHDVAGLPVVRQEGPVTAYVEFRGDLAALHEKLGDAVSVLREWKQLAKRGPVRIRLTVEPCDETDLPTASTTGSSGDRTDIPSTENMWNSEEREEKPGRTVREVLAEPVDPDMWCRDANGVLHLRPTGFVGDEPRATSAEPVLTRYSL